VLSFVCAGVMRAAVGGCGWQEYHADVRRIVVSLTAERDRQRGKLSAQLEALADRTRHALVEQLSSSWISVPHGGE
jgi:hypothetical protein